MESEKSVTSKEGGAVIELLSHVNGKFTVKESVTVTKEQKEFTLGGVPFQIKAWWNDVEVVNEMTNKNPKESHAVEIAWKENGKEETSWFYANGLGVMGAAPLGKTTIKTAVQFPGTRFVFAGAKPSTLKESVQFQWKKKRYDLPEVGKEVFPGWKLTKISYYQHAVIGEDGAISETPDAHFKNRVVEVEIEAKDGSKERHICFVDHPKLTDGIHPQILPVSRISGTLVSLSRLKVCDKLSVPVKHHWLMISPDTNGKGAKVVKWLMGKPSPEVLHIDEFPITIDFNGVKVTLKQHWSHALRQVKQREKKSKSKKAKHPAIFVVAGGPFHGKSFVFVQGRPTPCGIQHGMLIIRYRGQPLIEPDKK